MSQTIILLEGDQTGRALLPAGHTLGLPETCAKDAW
jgi:hypothetical protein